MPNAMTAKIANDENFLDSRQDLITNDRKTTTRRLASVREIVN
jgi:hypothetical protein